MLRTALAFGIGCWLLAIPVAADAQTPVPPVPPKTPKPDPVLAKTQRQISLLEKVIDQTLIESRHALVTRGPNCRGIRLPGYGVLFIVDLSPIVTGGEGIAHFRFKPDGSYEVEYENDKGKRTPIEGRTRTQGHRADPDEESDIEYVDDDADQDTDQDADNDKDTDKAGKSSDPAKGKASPEVPPELDDLVEQWKKWNPDTAARLADPERKEVFALVREELIDVLRDSAHSLTELTPDERIAIAIFPSDIDWRGPGTRTILEVRRRDVDAYQRGELTAEAFAARVQVETP